MSLTGFSWYASRTITWRLDTIRLTAREGSILQGHIRRRGQNSWAIVIDLGRDPLTGKRKQKWHVVHGEREDAERERVRLLNQLYNQEYVEPSKLTLGQFLARWLEDYAKINLRPTTYRSYEGLIRKHIAPALGRTPLTKLSALQLQRFYREKLDKGLSRRTVRYMHSILRRALGHAVKWQMLTRNIADAVEPPAMQKHEVQPLTVKDVQRLLNAAQDSRHYAAFLLALLAGLRRGEILGLRWQDVDLDAGRLMVRQALAQTERGEIIFQEPKTRKSRRQVPLSPMVVDALRKHRARQAEEKLQLGPEYEDHGLVFCYWNGRPMDPHNFVQRHFKPLLKKAGLPASIRFHDLRHTHATLLLLQGEHPKVVAERLGHSQINITLDTYSHLLPGIQEAAAERLEQTVFGVQEQTKKGHL